MVTTCLAAAVRVGWLEKLLAVVGGFVLGALLIGFLVNLIARLASGKPLPRVPLMVVRVLGGIVVGWLVMLWVMGGGGTGIGGFGGWGVGSGTGSGDGKDREGSGTYSGKEAEKENDKAVSPAHDVPALRVEVLGPAPLKKLAGTTPPDLNRCYRVNTPEGRRLLTLAEVKKLILPSEDGEPVWKRIELVLYGDSPNEDRKAVQDLKEWAEKLLLKDPKDKVRVAIYEPAENAPVK